jgi:hypothetical protein
MWRGLTAAEVFSIWDRTPRDPVDRALLLLRAADPALAPDACETLPLGARDRALIAIRRATLGPRLEATATCPACAAALELPLDCDDFSARADAGDRESDAGDRKGDAGDEPITAEAGGIRLQLRAPTSRDLRAAAAAKTVAAAEAALLAACVVAAEQDGRAIAADALPAPAREAAAAAILQHEPLAEVLLDLACPACGHGWAQPFDIAAFFFAELGQHARRLLGEIDLLARRYGWSEQDILAMSPARRQAYLDLESR